MRLNKGKSRNNAPVNIKLQGRGKQGDFTFWALFCQILYPGRKDWCQIPLPWRYVHFVGFKVIQITVHISFSLPVFIFRVVTVYVRHFVQRHFSKNQASFKAVISSINLTCCIVPNFKLEGGLAMSLPIGQLSMKSYLLEREIPFSVRKFFWALSWTIGPKFIDILF